MKNIQKKIWLSPPHMGGNEQLYVSQAFADNWIAPQGPHVNEFERRLSQLHQTKFAVALSSGTAAIHLGLIALGVGKGDIVIVQSKTFAASANPVIYQGAEPIFVDSESDTWNMCPEALSTLLKQLDAEGKIKKVKAIIPVHLYGMPAKMNTILSIAANYGIPILEDAAEAAGSKYRGRTCGSLSQVGVLSFNGNKIITTSGGGALLTHDEGIARKAWHYSTQSRESAPHFEHIHLGYNYRLSNVSASIGLGQLEVLEQRVNQRRSIFQRYRNYFDQFNAQGYCIKYQEEPESVVSNRWLTAIWLNPADNDGIHREHLRVAMAEASIEARPMWKPMHLQPLYQHCRYIGGGISAKLFEHGLCLPSGTNMSEEDYSRIFEVLHDVLEHRKLPKAKIESLKIK